MRQLFVDFKRSEEDSIVQYSHRVWGTRETSKVDNIFFL
jgi:hypothetical protein